jgi:hypothetical protein
VKYRVGEKIDRCFRSRHNCAEKDSENDNGPGEVLNSTIAEGKSLVGPLPRKKKCNAQWYGCRGISKIMDGIRQQPYAA